MHISKRNGISRGTAWAIRAIAIVLALITKEEVGLLMTQHRKEDTANE